jgi:hypothetical protein
MNNCFVIQPFDKGNFDNRYNDTFKPAIEKANLFPYRIDQDDSVRIPIEDIEKGISDSSICFAEITTGNPNVWYELGYAFARNKDVVMVCSEERGGKFPFDIQHRQVIVYKTGSKSDYEQLEEKVTKKIVAFLEKSKKVEKLQSSPVVETEGLKSHEIALLIIMAQSQFTSLDSVTIPHLKTEMNKAGYTDIATGVGIRTLIKKNFIYVDTEVDRFGEGYPYQVARVSDEGEDWILNNQDQLIFRTEDKKQDDELTF